MNLQKEACFISIAPGECIKEAVPDQPEHRNFGPLIDESVSKRPFPTSQSPIPATGVHQAECIKEAVPDQPEPTRSYMLSVVGVYQRGRSRPARANATQHAGAARSVSKRPFPTSQSASDQSSPTSCECIKEAVPDQPEPSARDMSL